MNVLGIIMARAGSKGLPDKCLRDLLGRPVLMYTFDHATHSQRLTDVVFTSDSADALALARQAGIHAIDRPAALATDTATVDDVARHAVEVWETKNAAQANNLIDLVVLLYGNIPIRKEGLIDRAIEKLIETGADSVRSVALISKQHPDWIHRLDDDRMSQFRKNSIYRRQDLEDFYYHDGAVAVVTREALFGALQTPEDKQSFLGEDRRAIVQEPQDAVDIDEPVDLYFAQAVLQAKKETTSEVFIGDRPIGTKHPVFVIAEAGVNHNGCVDTAMKMVDCAVEAGADAIKFQMFNANRLVTAEASTADYQKQNTPYDSQREMLSKLELSCDDFAWIKQYCDQRGIYFLATPFGEEEVAQLVSLDVQAIKIASTDLTNPLLIQAATATQLPLILSTGASSAEEIRQTYHDLAQSGATNRLIFMHCVSLYPTPMEQANLGAIAALQKEFHLPCGYSDHTTSTQTGAYAVSAGACVIEKHFTLDRSQSGPDHAMSLDPQPFTQYIEQVRDAQRALGRGQFGMTPMESEVRGIARRSVVTRADLSAGTILQMDMLTLKRPGTGIAPNELKKLLGKKIDVDIQKDTVITWEMVR